MSLLDRLSDAMREILVPEQALRPARESQGIPALERSRLLEKYQRIRAVSRKINDRLVGEIPKDVLHSCAKKLGLLVRGTLVFDDMNEMTILMDYCIHNGLVDGKSVIERFRETSPYPAGSEQAVQLEAYSRARFRLIAVSHALPGLGVEFIDLLRNERRLLIDIGFSQTAQPGLILGSRTVDFPEFSTTTGAALPVTAWSLDNILRELETAARSLRNIDPDNIGKEDEAELAAMILRAGLASREASRIRFQGAEDEEPDFFETDARPEKRGSLRLSMARQAPPPRISPNDPCPCGSNRKFKKCCGRPRP